MKSLLALLLLFGCASSSSTPAASAPTPTPAPLPRNQLADIPYQRVDYWVDRFTNGDKREEINAAFARMPDAGETIKAELRRRVMPEELVYLAMAESSLNPDAHSVADAVGVWQLVPDTARRYGLKVDDTVDERRDVAKSTSAALSYLSYLYNRLGSWYLAAAAYNTGENRVGRIMTAATGAEAGTDADYYKIWDQLPGETRDFVPAMVALMRIGKTR